MTKSEPRTLSSPSMLGLVVISLASAGCQAKHVVTLVSDLKMSENSSTTQFIAGFYSLEQHRFRWTSRRFAVILQPPKGSEQAGAMLRLQLYIPETEIGKLGPMTLTADVGDVSLAPETFTKAGLFSYSRHIPAALLRTDMFTVVFSVDKAFSSLEDPRELAVIVTEVSLEP
jgi:hypothetical protein